MKLELAIIENLQREDLNPIDRAMAFKQLAETFKLNHAEVGRKVGRSREFVSNSIRLLNLPDTIISAVSQGEITDGHARALLMLNDRPEEQDVVFREILLKKLSVREVERMGRRIATEKVRKKSPLDMDPELIEIEKQFTESLGTRVQISKTDYGGKIVIDYFSPEDLQKLLETVHGKHGTDEAASVAAIAEATPLELVPESAVDDRSENEIEKADTTLIEKEEEDLYSIKNFNL
jgi:ParB family transcriptional regulator, chromosome partitioning protein